MMWRLRPLIFAGLVTAAGTSDGCRRAEGLDADQAGGRDGLAAWIRDRVPSAAQTVKKW
jgi:hypothetical protein